MSLNCESLKALGSQATYMIKATSGLLPGLEAPTRRV